MTTEIAKREVLPFTGLNGYTTNVCTDCTNFFIGNDPNKAIYCEKTCLPVIERYFNDRRILEVVIFEGEPNKFQPKKI
jgi:hypothetical protein